MYYLIEKIHEENDFHVEPFRFLLGAVEAGNRLFLKDGHKIVRGYVSLANNLRNVDRYLLGVSEARHVYITTYNPAYKEFPKKEKFSHQRLLKHV